MKKIPYLVAVLGLGCGLGALPLTAGAQTASAPYTGTPIALPATFEAENFDRGGENVAYYDTTAGNLGGQYRTSEAVDIITSCDTAGGGYVVNNFAAGEWLKYTVNVPTTGTYTFELRTAHNFGTGPAFHLEVDGVPATGQIPVPKTGSWCTFQWVPAPSITLNAGQHVIRVVSDKHYFNFNSIRVTGAATAPTAPSYTGTPYSGTASVVPGTFQAENFDRGGEGVGYHENTAGNQGGQYRLSEDPDIIAACDTAGGAYVVNNFTTGEWLNYTINVTAAGSYVVQLRAANNYSTATPVAFHVEIDGRNMSGSVRVPNTGGWCNFQWVPTPAMALPAGRHVLKIFADQQYFNLNSVNVTSAAAIAPTPPPTPTPGAVSWSCDFEGTYCGFGEQNAVGDRQGGRSSLVPTARSGNLAVRLHTEPGDSNVHGSGSWERNDLILGSSANYCNPGQEEWWAHSILFPDDYVFPPVGGQAGILFDFHHSASTGQSNFEIQTIPGVGLRFEGHGGPTISGGRYDFVIPDPYGAPAGTVRKNVWYDFVYHVRWDSSSNGFMEAWVNGKKIMTFRGPTLYSGIGCYLKLANYHGAYGVATSVIHDRVIRGTSASAVSLTPLGP